MKKIRFGSAIFAASLLASLFLCPFEMVRAEDTQDDGTSTEHGPWQVGESYYETLQDAVDANPSGAVINFVKPSDQTSDYGFTTDPGVVIAGSGDYTINMKGSIVQFYGTAEGCNSDIVLRPGSRLTIDCGDGENTGMIIASQGADALIENYSDLTITDSQIYGPGTPGSAAVYSVSGNVILNGKTDISTAINDQGKETYAITVGYDAKNYPKGTSVTLDTTGYVNSPVTFVNIGEEAGTSSKATSSLTILNGTIRPNFKVPTSDAFLTDGKLSRANLSIKGGTFINGFNSERQIPGYIDFRDYLADGYAFDEKGNVTGHDPEVTASPAAPAVSPAVYDDGGPFTKDDCGNVYDRWGNRIWSAPTCIVSENATSDRKSVLGTGVIK